MTIRKSNADTKTDNWPLTTDFYGNSYTDTSRDYRFRQRWAADAFDFAVVARGCSLLSPARSRGGRHRFTAAVLDRHRLRLRNLVPLQRRRRPALSRVLLSGRD